MLRSARICVLLFVASALAVATYAQQATTTTVAQKQPYRWLSDPNFAQTLTIVGSRPFISARSLRYSRMSSFRSIYNLGVNFSDRQIISPQFYPFSNVIVSAPTSASIRRVALRTRPGRWSWSQWSPKPDLPGATPGGVVSQPFIDRQLLYSLPSGRRSTD